MKFKTQQAIAVMDRGFVYVGKCSVSDGTLRIENAKNIRRWGTTGGLGELRNGPLPSTILDVVGEIVAPERAVIHLIPCQGF